MKRDYKWLESIMEKHGVSLYDVTCYLYEYLVTGIDRMYENEEVDMETEAHYEAIIDDIKAFVWGREE